MFIFKKHSTVIPHTHRSNNIESGDVVLQGAVAGGVEHPALEVAVGHGAVVRVPCDVHVPTVLPKPVRT